MSLLPQNVTAALSSSPGLKVTPSMVFLFFFDDLNAVEGQFTPLSKPFRTKAAAEKARLKLSERERRSVAVGVIRIKK